MPMFTIIAGDFKEKPVMTIGEKVVFECADGTALVYDLRKGLKSVDKISQMKKTILFEMHFTDGKSLKAEASEKEFEKLHFMFEKYKHIMEDSYRPEIKQPFSFASLFGVKKNEVKTSPYKPPVQKTRTEKWFIGIGKFFMAMILLGFIVQFCDGDEQKRSQSASNKTVSATATNTNAVKHNTLYKDSENRSAGKKIVLRIALNENLSDSEIKRFLKQKYNNLRDDGYKMIFIDLYESKAAYEKGRLMYKAQLKYPLNAKQPSIEIETAAKMKEKYGDDVLAAIAPQVAEEPKNYGYWRTNKSRSKLDDSTNVEISLRANENYKSAFGKLIKPVLYITCRENKTELYIDWQTYLGLDETKVIARLDKDKAQQGSWGLSTDNEATFKSRPIGFIRSMTGKDELYTQTVPYGENPISATFKLEGLEHAIKDIQQACNWR